MSMAVTMSMSVGMTMSVVMHMLIFLCVMDLYGKMRAGDTAFDAFFCTYHHARDSQVIHPVQKSFFVRNQFQQGRCQHIAGCAHAAVNVQCSHFLTSM